MLSGDALRSIKIKGGSQLSLQNVKLAKSALCDTIYAGYVKKNGYEWSSKKDVTNDFLACVLHRWLGFSEKITAGDKVYEITVREITE